MKKYYMLVFIVIIGTLTSIIGHVGVKKYFYRNYFDKKINKSLVINDALSLAYNPKYSEIEESNNEIENIDTIKEEVVNVQETTKVVTTTTEMKTTILTTTTKKIEETLIEETIQDEVYQDDGTIIYDNLSYSELVDKLNKSLNSNLTNTGYYFVDYYKQTGLDPYLSVAIVLHETGCKWTCSKLVRECNNVGGMKGSPGCNGGNYKKYDTLEDGIKGYLDMLYNNYYSKGLNTPELINPKYAASTAWSEKINNYILEIKSK